MDDNNSFKYEKPSLLHPGLNETVPGFNFDKNDFEDLIDNFTPKDDIPILLGVTHPQLDIFCMSVYHMKFNDTYKMLLKRSELYYRKAMFNLSKSGNPTAIKIASEFYVGLGNVEGSKPHITIINNMPDVPSDVDKLSDEAAASIREQAELENQKQAALKAIDEFEKKHEGRY